MKVHTYYTKMVSRDKCDAGFSITYLYYPRLLTKSIIFVVQCICRSTRHNSIHLRRPIFNTLCACILQYYCLGMCFFFYLKADLLLTINLYVHICIFWTPAAILYYCEYCQKTDKGSLKYFQPLGLYYLNTYTCICKVHFIPTFEINLILSSISCEASKLYEW